jgi:hypothetical protein
MAGCSANFVCDIPAGALRQWLTRLFRGTGHLSKHAGNEQCRQYQESQHPRVGTTRGRGFTVKIGHEPHPHQSKWLWLVWADYQPRPEKGQAGHHVLSRQGFFRAQSLPYHIRYSGRVTVQPERIASIILPAFSGVLLR